MNRCRHFILCCLCSVAAVALLPGCAAFDAAWETLDPMGHRSEHQARHYPRGKTTGIKLPGDSAF
ncbi:MAG: hypothetical protein ACKVY0_22115 [Prosthecobacter sp.]|uniref:hypothetical protein n=1 Tax=Prosthecobacter sp. TaxID=1965333 RepID=UPI0039042917